jgi:hypothetical protein
MDADLEQMCKETALVYFKTLYSNFNGESEENYGNHNVTCIFIRGSKY